MSQTPDISARRSRKSALFTTVALFAALGMSGCDGSSSNQAAGMQGMPPGGSQQVEAGYIVVHSQPVVISGSVAGRVVSYNTAEIRPQVGGIIKERVFREGTEVRKGDILYRLDAESFEAALASAQATVQKTEAALWSAKAKYDRYKTLSTSSAVSQQDRDDAESSYLQAQADIAAAKADVQTAKINLGYTTIAAPIGGQIGTSSVDVGSLVTSSQTDALATIRQIDPVYVDLTESSGNLIKFRNLIKTGGFSPLVGSPTSKAQVHVSFADGTPYDGVGEIVTADQFVAQTTGTFTIRSQFANPERLLLPGMYVLGTISLASDKNGFLLPQRAVSRNAKGEATARFIKADGTVETRIIVAATDIGSNWLVTSGVADGDKLIVDGLQNVQDGKPVKPVEVKLDANGLEVSSANATDGAQPASEAK